MRKKSLHVSRHFKLSLVVLAAVAVIVSAVKYGNVLNAARLDAHLASSSMLTPERCLSFEEFDPQEFVCVARCDGTACKAVERNYRRILDVLSLDDLKMYFGFIEEPYESGISEQYSIDPNSVANRTYAIENGTVGEETFRTGSPLFARPPAELWKLFTYAIPMQWLARADEFLILNDFHARLPAQAWVAQTGTSTWQIALNEGMSFTARGNLIDRGSVVRSLIHEGAHIMSLNDEEFDSTESAWSCKTLALYEGCARQHSYLFRFAREFWPTYNYVSNTKAREFIKGEFVSGYAAVNPVEDFADSWAAFVLFPKPHGDTIADKKILFFYEYPEFLRIRNEIREQMGRIR